MELTMLKSKIHRATVTQAELDYVGSITIDIDLLNASGIREYEQVQIVNINNGARFTTYTIAGESGSGLISVYGIIYQVLYLLVYVEKIFQNKKIYNGNTINSPTKIIINFCGAVIYYNFLYSISYKTNYKTFNMTILYNNWTKIIILRL